MVLSIVSTELPICHFVLDLQLACHVILSLMLTRMYTDMSWMIGIEAFMEASTIVVHCDEERKAQIVGVRPLDTIATL